MEKYCPIKAHEKYLKHREKRLKYQREYHIRTYVRKRAPIDWKLDRPPCPFDVYVGSLSEVIKKSH